MRKQFPLFFHFIIVRPASGSPRASGNELRPALPRIVVGKHSAIKIQYSVSLNRTEQLDWKMDSGKLSAIARSVCETVGVWPFKSLRTYLLNGSVSCLLDLFSVHRDRALRFNCLRFWMESHLEHGVLFVYEKFKMFKWPFPLFFEFIFIFSSLTISLSFRYIIAISFVRKTNNTDYLSLKLHGVLCPQ